MYRYWESAIEDVGKSNEENVRGFILCPEYKCVDLESEKSIKELGDKYDIISYDKIYKPLCDSAEYIGGDDRNFRDFVDALFKHTLSSVPQVKYEEMRTQFITRINKKDNV